MAEDQREREHQHAERSEAEGEPRQRDVADANVAPAETLPVSAMPSRAAAWCCGGAFAAGGDGEAVKCLITTQSPESPTHTPPPSQASVARFCGSDKKPHNPPMLPADGQYAKYEQIISDPHPARISLA